MVAAQMAESESEETQERVRAKAIVTTKPGEGMNKLGQQIAQLMTALTQTRQGSSPISEPGSPQECGCRCGHSGRTFLVAQTIAMVRVALARWLQPAVCQQSMW